MSESLIVENGSKVFVGNVPFQCTREEFQACFSTMDGFITADIIRRYRSRISRGFGFVVFANQEQANSLLTREDIKLKDRTLRFSNYDHKIHDNREQPTENTRGKPKERFFTIFVKGLAPNTTSEQLSATFQVHGEVISASVYERDNRFTGVVTMNTEEGYNTALSSQYDNGVSVYPYRRRKLPQQRHTIGYTDPKVAYREGMKAGQIVGYKEGYDAGYTDGSQGLPKKN